MNALATRLTPLAIVLTTATGCLGGHDTTGEWTGTCDLGYMGYDYLLDFELDMVDDGGDLSGTAIATDTYQIPIPGIIEGERKGKKVAFDILPDYGTDSMYMTDTGFTFGTTFGLDISVEAEHKKNTLEGECNLTVFMFALSGELVLERE